MKLTRLLPVLLLVLVAVGCGSAERRLVAANDLVGSTYATIADARDAQLITQAELEPYRQTRESIDQLLDDAGKRIRAQRDDEADTLITEARRLLLVELRPIVNLIETLRAGKPRPSPAQPRPEPWTQ